eukprot:123688-Amorphochlora_amoeboformis.AAC.1
MDMKARVGLYTRARRHGMRVGVRFRVDASTLCVTVRVTGRVMGFGLPLGYQWDRRGHLAE